MDPNTGGQVACRVGDPCTCEVQVCVDTWQTCASTDTCCTGYCAVVNNEAWPTCGPTDTGCACVPYL
jgi:hypothetical protein